MAVNLWDKNGKMITFNFPVDANEALSTGKYTRLDPKTLEPEQKKTKEDIMKDKKVIHVTSEDQVPGMEKRDKKDKGPTKS